MVIAEMSYQELREMGFVVCKPKEGTYFWWHALPWKCPNMLIRTYWGDTNLNETQKEDYFVDDL